MTVTQRGQARLPNPEIIKIEREFSNEGLSTWNKVSM
jgi:hypothetical protein